MKPVRNRKRSAVVLAAAGLALSASVLNGPAPGQAAAGRATASGSAIAADATVLVVVGNPAALTAGDRAVVDRFSGLGLTPSLADDRLVTAADAAAHTMVYVAQSSTPTLAAVRGIGSAPVPLWVADTHLFDDYGLTGPDPGTDYANRPATAITIVNAAHPMAAGHSGTVTLQAAGDKLSWGLPVASATTVATVGSNRAAAFAVEAGDALYSGAAAPACRLTFPVSDVGVRTFTPAAWDMFDATATWLADNCPPPTPPDPPGDGVEHVVVLSVDGFTPAALTSLGATRAPNFHRLMAQGASTLNARAMVEVTRTLPNHTSEVTSARIGLPQGHGVRFNEDNGSTVHATAGRYVASVFDVVHDAGGSTTMYAGKPKFDFLDRSWDATNGAADVTGANNGRDKIDVYVRNLDSGHLIDLLNTRLENDPASFSFVHFDDPDKAGHNYGWLSPEYLAALESVDGWVGEVLDTIASDPGLAASTVVVLTADHGGSGPAHGDATDPANYTIPFMAWGAGVAPGADLYALNPDRQQPGTLQPGYQSAVPPIRNGDVANLVTELLDLGPVPGSEMNADQGLDLAAP